METSLPAVVAPFIARARSLTREQWAAPRAPDKWTPCQEARHLVLTYRLCAEAVLGQRELTPVVSAERSQVLYSTVVPMLLRGGALPKGARSPSEADPGAELQAADVVLRDLDLAEKAFHAALLEVSTKDPQRRVRHPYFGLLSMEELAAVIAAHTRHHTDFLPAPVPAD